MSRGEECRSVESGSIKILRARKKESKTGTQVMR